MLWLVLAAGAGAGIVLLFGSKPPSPPPPPIPIAITQPTGATTQSAATAPAPTLQTYGQLLHADLPNYPETRPWGIPVELNDAAHLVLDEPVYVCSRGDLWITRAGADPLPVVLARAAGESEHLVDRRIAYVVWALNRRGFWEPSAVCQKNDGYEIISKTDRRPIPWHRPYRWDLATTWDDGGVTRLIVPTDAGISIITVGRELTEDYCQLMDTAATTKPTGAPAVLFDTRGLLAWIPADGDFAQTRVARYLDGRWAQLDSTIWPGDVVYLLPRLDGSVLQIRRGPGAAAMSFVTLDNPDIDDKEVLSLVDQLGDDDPDKRVAAYQRLSQYGPKINPILQKLAPGAAPEAQARIQELLQGTTLGGMSVNGNQLTLVARLRDGGMVFRAPQGVTIPQEGQNPKIVSPDYLAVRPGRPVQELGPAIVDRLSQTNSSIAAWGDEWIVTSPDVGPARFLPPNQLDPLLRQSERNFSRLIAIDSRGRWLLTDDAAKRTLILDPTVPDPTPRLAIWLIDTGNSAGWNKSDWPAIGRGTARWIIDDHDWEPMDEPLQTVPPRILQPPMGAASAPEAAAASGSPLLLDADGNRYYDGRSTVTLVSPTGRRRVWPLPDRAAGSVDQPAYLAGDRQGHLFLFNSIGRIARLRLTLADPQPLVLESVFTDRVPDFHDIERIWCDPAGRIDVAYQGSRLALIFPTGQVPREIEDKILPQDLRRIEAP
jgi:hypothetical protein